MIALTRTEEMTLAQAIECLMKLHDQTVKKDVAYATGFVHGTLGQPLSQDSDRYLDGYAAGGIVAEARAITKERGLRLAKPPGKTQVSRSEVATIPTIQQTADAREISRLQGYTGNACTRCGGVRLLRSGTCERCSDCGETTGCS